MAELLRTVQAGTLVRGDIVRRGRTLHRVDAADAVVCPIQPAVRLAIRDTTSGNKQVLTVDATDPVAVLIVGVKA